MRRQRLSRLVRYAALAELVLVNLIVGRDLIVDIIAWWPHPTQFDYWAYVAATKTAAPYAGMYIYSPLAIPIFALAAFVGPTIWQLAHVGAVLALRRPALIAIVVTSYPFLFDADDGGVMIFVALAGYYALRGSRPAIWLTYALALLMPRPMMVPIVAWLLWEHPETRRPFAGLVALYVPAVLLTGLAPAWLARIGHETTWVAAMPWNWAPSRLVGWWWTPIGFALAVPLFLAGRIGLAAIAIQPYFYPHYLLVLLWEVARGRRLSSVLRVAVEHRRLARVAERELERGDVPALVPRRSVRPRLTDLEVKLPEEARNPGS